MADESWMTANFRINVVNKIKEAIVQSGMTSSMNSRELENHFFRKSHNKDQYLSYVARFILHVREMSKAKNTPNKVQDGNNSQQQQGHNNEMVNEIINAIENLTTE